MDYPPNFINLIGQTFGELYVFEKAENDPKGCARFLARCSCGDERRYESKELRNLKRTACPKCLREAKKSLTVEKREASAQKILEEKRGKFDISGTKVKDWTVLRPVKDGNFDGAYACQCRCGTEFNYQRSLLTKECVPSFCKKCREKNNRIIGSEIKRNTEEKEDLLFKTSGSAICCKCNFELNISEFSRRRFKLGSVVCKKCESEYNALKREEWFKENNSREFLNCPKCDCVFERNSLSDSFLKIRRPLCKDCLNSRNEKLKDKYEAINRKKEFIVCSDCGEGKSLTEYYNSSLRFSTPRCSLCVSKYGNEYHGQKYKKDHLYKEKYDIGRKIAHSLEKKGWKKDATAATYLGIDKNGFLKHLESLFREGMSFENRGEWHLDHVVPLSTAETPEDIKRLWHYTNLQPLWKFENEEKSNLLDWRERFDWAKDIVELRKKRGLE